jgi:hypothetical protein
MQATDNTVNTVPRWESVIAELTTKQQSARQHVEQLQEQKRDLALEAAMGGADARKKLDKANAELARLTLESDDWDAAIAQAQNWLADAREAEVAEAEQERRSEMRTLASAALRHAAEFDVCLRQASNAGAALKLAIQNALARATPDERRNLDRLLEAGPYMRAAEYAGLRAHLEFQAYPGLKAHITSLEETVPLFIGNWLTSDRTEEK